MNRTVYFNYIADKLGYLAYSINLKGKLNILDLHNHSENFYAYFLNALYDWNLMNFNSFKQNVEAIDLIDHTNKCIIQVSATNTKGKVESSLNKAFINTYSSYKFKFVLISGDGARLRNDTFLNPYSISFIPETDIIDNKSIMAFILSSNIDKQKEIYKLIQKELGSEVDIVKLDSNLAVIINILSKEDLNLNTNITINKFDIERKITHNDIDSTKSIINEFAKYHPRLDKKYSEFDSLGINKSLSVLQSISSSYIESCVKFKGKDSDCIFLQVIENIKDKVLGSANYVKIPKDELELCIKIIVVDAFIRCKIFKNPQDYNYAPS